MTDGNSICMILELHKLNKQSHSRSFYIIKIGIFKQQLLLGTGSDQHSISIIKDSVLPFFVQSNSVTLIDAEILDDVTPLGDLEDVCTLLAVQNVILLGSVQIIISF